MKYTEIIILRVIENMKRKTIIIILIQLAIAGLHLLDLEKLGGDSWFRFYRSWFSDLALPFGMYFLLGNMESQFHFLKNWWTKAIVVFAVAAAAEVLQFFGIICPREYV